MHSQKERQHMREQELEDMMRARNLKLSLLQYGIAYYYIKNGGRPNATEVCTLLEETQFFQKNAKHIKRAYYSKEQNDMILIEYIKQNHNNIHKILSEIPWSLKHKVDIIFEAIKNGYDMNSIILILNKIN